jgi:hypothetical protein
MTSATLLCGALASLCCAVLPADAQVAQGPAAAPDSAIVAFVQDHGDPSYRANFLARLKHPSFTLFSAGSNIGVAAGDRIGWLRQPADLWGSNRLADTLTGPAWFDLRAGDTAIAATAADPRLASVPAVQLRVWRTFVAQSPETPLSTLLALVRLDQTLGPAVAASPRLLESTSPVPQLIALADASDHIAAVVVQNPVFLDHPLALATIAERHPAVWSDAMHRLLDNEPALEAAGSINERLAVHLAYASWALGQDSAARAGIASLPAMRQSAMARAVLALAADIGQTTAPPAPMLGLRELVGRLYGDTLGEVWLPTGLPPAMAQARAVRADRVLLWSLAQVDGRAANGRWRSVRVLALKALAEDRTAPVEDLRRVAEALDDTAYWHHDDPRMPDRSWVPEGVVSAALMQNPRAAGDRTVLQSISALPIGKFGDRPLAAAQRLRSSGSAGRP